MKRYKVKDIFDVLSGSTPSTSIPEYWNGPLKWITPKDLSGLRTATIETTERRITTFGFDSCSAQLIPKGSIIISSRAPIGYVAVLEDDMCCNQGCKALVPKEKVDPFYIYYLLRSKKQELNNMGSGSTFKELSKSKLEEFPIRLPKYSKQKEIAHILFQADNARQQRKVANALTEQFLQATFLSLFGDPVRNEKGWEVKSIAESGCKVQIGPFGTQLHVEDYIEGGIPLINPKHIQGSRIREHSSSSITLKKFEELKNYHLEEGDVIMGRRGEMGRCAVITKRESGWLCGTGSLFIRPSEQINPTYLHSVISSNTMRKILENESQGVTMANLNQTIINNLKLPIPPVKVQQHFASIIAQTEHLRQRQQAHTAELEGLFQSLLQKYFA